MTDLKDSQFGASAEELVDAFLERGAGQTGEEMDSLMDTASGLFIILTQTSVHFVDLSSSRVVRTPRIVDGAELALLRRDGDWLNLITVHDCTVGRGLRIMIELGKPGSRTLRIETTPIEAIVPLVG